MFTDFYRAFYYGFLITSAIISLLCFRKAEKSFQWLCVLVILTLISELIARYLSLHRKPNGMVYSIFTPVEYFIYTNIYKFLFNEKKWSKILNATIVGLVTIEVTNSIFFQGFNEAPTNVMNIESVLLVILSLALFIKIREKPVYENVLTEGVFWFNSIVLCYYSFDILIWGFHSIVYHLQNPPSIIYHILLLFSGVLYIVFAVSVLVNNFSVKRANIKV